LALSFVLLVILLYFTPKVFIIHLIPVGIISIGYTIPFLSGKRLRDLNFLKIFLIAIVWSYVACLPVIVEIGWTALVIPFLFEKFFFLMAITLPFDIRDIKIDKGLKTIPKLIGTSKSYALAQSFLFLGLLCSLLIWWMASSGGACHSQHTVLQWMAVTVISYLITSFLIHLSKNKESDYYFSGLLDSTLCFKGALLTLGVATSIF